MKIGIIKEGKTPPDKRVAFSPSQCKEITERYPEIKIVVQKSDIRTFNDKEYSQKNIQLVENVSDCDVLIGIKEVPTNELIPNKTYLFFSHTTKKQPHNQKLLKTLLREKITMVDYEHLTNKEGQRIIGFGRYAGIVGCYNALYAYGERTGKYSLKRAYLCQDKEEMVSEMAKINLPNNYKIVLTGSGRVGKGALEVLTLLKIKQVTPEEFKTKEFTQPVFTILNSKDYYQQKDGGKFVKQFFYENPEKYQSSFMDYASVADMYVACHFWNPLSPKILTTDNLKSSELGLKVIADISCDVGGPIDSTIRSSSIESPLYGYDPLTKKETSFNDKKGITIMAVDNLPCELSKDASEFFGKVFIKEILPHLLKNGNKIINRATICSNGELSPSYLYLRDYVNG